MRKLILLLLLYVCASHAKVYDCFTFFNELELLRIRLEELEEQVDYFVLVEATRTFSGKPKPLYYKENTADFLDFQHKIIHVVVDDYPVATGDHAHDNWARERHQRNALLRGLTQCELNDIVLVSDADEIVRASVMPKIKERLIRMNRVRPGTKTLRSQVVVLDLKPYSCQLNRTSSATWCGPVKAVPFWAFKFVTPDNLRLMPQAENKLFVISNAGWHFNTMGDLNRAILKWNSVSTAPIESITRESGASDFDVFFNRHYSVPVDEGFPKYVREHLEYFKSIGWIGEAR